MLNLPAFVNDITETIEDGEKVNRMHHQNKTYLVGALARLHLNSEYLHQKAKLLWKKAAPSKIAGNSFYNVYAQAVEIVHFTEECRNLLDQVLNLDLKKSLVSNFKIQAGAGLAAAEAPRGTLIHYYELNDSGRVINCNIITPTAQFLSNLEEDLKFYLPDILDLPQVARQNKIRTLVRAYDPCISCATH